MPVLGDVAGSVGTGGVVSSTGGATGVGDIYGQLCDWTKEDLEIISVEDGEPSSGSLEGATRNDVSMDRDEVLYGMDCSSATGAIVGAATIGAGTSGSTGGVGSGYNIHDGNRSVDNFDRRGTNTVGFSRNDRRTSSYAGQRKSQGSLALGDIADKVRTNTVGIADNVQGTSDDAGARGRGSNDAHRVPSIGIGESDVDVDEYVDWEKLHVQTDLGGTSKGGGRDLKQPEDAHGSAWVLGHEPSGGLHVDNCCR
eukprot:m.17158 g.17158  ORF g.17158 m.17158 type:complete len:254 (-) comp11156_c0_seq1:1707-2468(-)